MSDDNSKRVYYHMLAVCQGAVLGLLCLVCAVLTWRRTRFIKIIVQLVILAATNILLMLSNWHAD